MDYYMDYVDPRMRAPAHATPEVKAISVAAKACSPIPSLGFVLYSPRKSGVSRTKRARRDFGALTPALRVWQIDIVTQGQQASLPL